MKITHCIQELEHLISEDGDLEVEGVFIDKDNLKVKIDKNWFRFNEYEKYNTTILDGNINNE